MTLEKNSGSAPESIVGPVRYTLVTEATQPSGITDPDAFPLSFVVNALALPRVGDSLLFELDGAPLMLSVTHVSHWFTPPGNPPNRFITVAADPYPIYARTVVRLQHDPAALQQWLDQFPMLEPDPLALR